MGMFDHLIPAEQTQGSNMFEHLVPKEKKTPIPLTDYWDIQGEMERSGRKSVVEGFRRMRGAALPMEEAPEGEVRMGELGKGALQTLGGAVEWAGSPIWAAYRSAIGLPLERVTGIPKEYTEFAAQLATPGIGLTRLGRPPVQVTPPAPATDVLRASQALGIPLPRAVTSESPLTQTAGRVVQSVPVAATPIRRASTEAIEGLEEAATGARQQLGSGQTAASGSVLREGVEDFLSQGPVKRRVEALYNRVDHMVQPGAVGPMPQTRQVALDIEGRRAAAGLPRSKSNTLLDEILGRAGISYQGIKDLRTFFGEMLENRQPIPEGMAKTEVERIYGALSDDLRGVVEATGGPNAVRVWERANALASRWADTRSRLAKFLKADNDQALIDKIAVMANEGKGGNLEMLNRIRGSLPADQWEEVASSVVARMGWPKGGTGFSPDAFLTAYNGMAQPARQMLFGPVADTLDNIAVISQRYKQLHAFANPSGTARHVIGFEMLVHPIVTLKALGLGIPLARYLASPEGPRMLAQWQQAQRGPIGARQMANRVLANGMSKVSGMPFEQVQGQLEGNQ